MPPSTDVANLRSVLSESEILNLARFFGQRPVDAALFRETIEAQRLQPPETGGQWQCATPLYNLFRSSVAAAGPKLRSEVESLLPAGIGQAKSALTQSYCTQHFTLMWDSTQPLTDLQAPAGPLVIGGRDFGTLADSSVPKFVQAVGLVLETAWRTYVQDFAFRDPCTKHPTEVTFMDLQQEVYGYAAGLGRYNPEADCGSILLHYQLDSIDIAGVPLHEFFHVIQGKYHPLDGVQPEVALWSEGSADIAPDFVADQLNVWMKRFTFGFLQLVPRPALNEMLYAAAGIWRYLLEQCTYPATDGQPLASALRRCWEYTAGRPELTAKLFAEAFDSLAPRHTRFSVIRRTRPAGLDVLCSDTLIGDFMLAATSGTGYSDKPAPDPRFGFAENQEAPGLLALRNDFTATITSQAPVSFSAGVKPWEFRFCAFQVDPNAGMVLFEVDATPPAAAQVVLTNDGDCNVVRSDRLPFCRVLAAAGTQGVFRLGILSLADRPCALTVSAKILAPRPDLVITRANCEPGFDSERNPASKPWDGTSPDIYIGAPGQLEFDVIAAGNVGKVGVRVHNRGLAEGTATVRLSFQRLIGAEIVDTAWQPMRDKAPGDPAAKDQTLTMVVPYRSEATAEATWYINEDSGPIPPKDGKGQTGYTYGHHVRIFRGAARYAIRADITDSTLGSRDNNCAVQFVAIYCRQAKDEFVRFPAQPHKTKPSKETRPGKPHKPKPKPKPKKDKPKRKGKGAKKSPTTGKRR